MRLEVEPGTPDRPAVRALIETLAGLEPAEPAAVGRACGGRVAVVWLGESLELASLVLEPHELDDAHAARSRALEFVADVRRAAQAR